MIRVGFIADLHLANHRIAGGSWQGGLNDRGRLTVDTFGNALSIAEAKGCSSVVAAGDVFDTTRPEPQLIAATQRMINMHDVDIDIIMGNHDQDSSEKGDHALGPLGELNECRVYERPDVKVLEDGAELIMMPFMAGPASEWFPREVDKLMTEWTTRYQHVHTRTPARVLVTHLGIHDQNIRDGSIWAGKADDAISFEQLTEVCERHGITMALAGNWHGRTKFASAMFTALQIGTLCPTGWDNPGMKGYGSLITIEFDKGAVTTVVVDEIPGPRFINVVSEKELADAIAQNPRSSRKNQLFIRWSAKPADVSAARASLEDWQASGEIFSWDIRVDKEDGKLQAAAAAQAARSASTLQGVLGAYVAKMPLVNALDRDEVFRRCDAYLK